MKPGGSSGKAFFSYDSSSVSTVIYISFCVTFIILFLFFLSIWLKCCPERSYTKKWVIFFCPVFLYGPNLYSPIFCWNLFSSERRCTYSAGEKLSVKKSIFRKWSLGDKRAAFANSILSEFWLCGLVYLVYHFWVQDFVWSTIWDSWSIMFESLQFFFVLKIVICFLNSAVSLLFPALESLWHFCHQV